MQMNDKFIISSDAFIRNLWHTIINTNLIINKTEKLRDVMTWLISQDIVNTGHRIQTKHPCLLSLLLAARNKEDSIACLQQC